MLVKFDDNLFINPDDVSAVIKGEKGTDIRLNSNHVITIGNLNVLEVAAHMFPFPGPLKLDKS